MADLTTPIADANGAALTPSLTDGSSASSAASAATQQDGYFDGIPADETAGQSKPRTRRFSLRALKRPFSGKGRASVGGAALDSTIGAEDEATAAQDEAEDLSGAPASPSAAAAPGAPIPFPTSEEHPDTAKEATSSTATKPKREPRRVSFSPSTEELSEAREAASLTAEAVEERKRAKEETRRKKDERKASRAMAKAARAAQAAEANAQGVDAPERLASLSKGAALSSPPAPTDYATRPPVRRRSLSFTWDRKGVHATMSEPSVTAGGPSLDKGRSIKPKVSRKNAIAARHARTLELIINANAAAINAGLPVNGDAAMNAPSASGSKRSKAVPIVSAKDLKGLKSALIDVDLANGIIAELRAMRIPVGDAAPQFGSVEKANLQKERIIAAPDDAVDPLTKVPNGPSAGSTVSPATQQQTTDSKSPAQQALEQISGATSPQPGSPDTQAEPSAPTPRRLGVRQRVSSLTSRAKSPGEHKAKAKHQPVWSDSPHRVPHPVRAVCLDCDEYEAHRRHIEHHARSSTDAAAAAAAACSPSPSAVSAAEAGASLAAAATAWSVAAWLGRKFGAAASATGVSGMAASAMEIEEDLTEGDLKEAANDAARLSIELAEMQLPALAKPALELVKDNALAENKPAGQVTEEKKAQSQAETAAVAMLPEPAAKASGMPSLPELPVLPANTPGGLAGVSPISLLMSPGTTLAGVGATKSGTFDALGSIAGAAIRADAGGEDAMNQVRPPLDRIAIYVHWWGFEITMPKPSMSYLGTAQSVSGAFLSFLQTMVVSGGVPELLPFVRYISQFMDLEFAAIKSQDKGNGVIVAATFFMPFALVPRPWDYSTEPLPRPMPAPAPLPAPSPAPTPAPAPGSIPPALPILAVRALQAGPAPRRNSSPSGPRNTTLAPAQAVALAARESYYSPSTTTSSSPRGSFSSASGAAGMNGPGMKLDSLAELPEGSLRIKA